MLLVWDKKAPDNVYIACAHFGCGQLWAYQRLRDKYECAADCNNNYGKCCFRLNAEERYVYPHGAVKGGARQINLDGPQPTGILNSAESAGKLIHWHCTPERGVLVQIHDEYCQLNPAANSYFFENPEEIILHRMLADVQAS